MPYSITLPSGNIADGIPDHIKRDDALIILRQQLPQEFPTPEASSLKKGFEQFGQAVKTGLKGLPSLVREEDLADEQKRSREAILGSLEVQQKFKPQVGLDIIKDVYEQEGFLGAAKEAVSQIPSAIAEQATTIGASVAGAKAGALTFGKFGPYGALFGGIGGGALPIFLQLFGSNLERQASEKLQRGEDLTLEEGKAFSSAAAGTAAEFALLLPRMGRKVFMDILGDDAKAVFKKNMTDKELIRLDKLAKENLPTSVAKGFGVGAVAEGATEIAQQMLERAQADLPLFTEDAFKEYAEAGYQATLVGGPLGGAGRTYESTTAPQDAREIMQQKAILEEKKLDKEEKRSAEVKEDLNVVEEEVAVPANVRPAGPAQNFLGNVGANELPDDLRRTVNKKRKKDGKVGKLSSYSMEDLFDGLEPQQYETDLDNIIAAKLKEKNPDIDLTQDVSYDVINELAIQNGLTPGGEIFNNFVKRTVGTDKIGSLSPIKRLAVFEALKISGSDIGNTLTTNANIFNQKQYDASLNKIKEISKTTKSIDEPLAISEIKKVSGLNSDKDAEAMLLTMRENGDLQQTNKRSVEVFLPKGLSGTSKTPDTKTFETRKEAEDFAKNRKNVTITEKSKPTYNLPEAIPDYLPNNTKIEPVKFGVKREGAFEVFQEDEPLPQRKTFDSQADAESFMEEASKTREKIAKQIEGQIKKESNVITAQKQALTQREVAGEGATKKDIEAVAIKKRIRESEDKIKQLTEKLDRVNRPLNIKSTQDVYAKVRNKFVLKDADGKVITRPDPKDPKKDLQYFDTRAEAESFALAGLNNAQLQSNIRPGGEGTTTAIENASIKELGRRTNLDLGASRETYTNKVKLLEEQKEKLRKNLLPVLEKIGLKSVGLNILGQLDKDYALDDGRVPYGRYSKQLIQIALTAPSPMQTLKHEAIHALKEMGAFTDSQWRALTKKSKEVYIKKYLTQDQIDMYNKEYGNNSEALIEEGIAEAFANFDRVLFEGEKGDKPIGGIRSVFERIKKFFEALKNSLQGLGFTTTEDIFGGIVKGEFADSIKQPDVTGRQDTYFRIDDTKPPKLNTKQVVNSIEDILGRVNKRIQKDNSKFTMNKINKAYAKLGKFIEEGIEGKDWYENSAKEILKAFDNNDILTDKFIQVLAITSPSTEVKANVKKAANAWNQWAEGKEITAGTKDQNQKVRDLLEFGLPFSGRKTNTFYRNFMEAIEEINGKDSTIDLHMARMLFNKDVPSPAEYDLAEALVEIQSRQTGLPPRKIQAATWVRQKQQTIFNEYIKKGQHKKKSRAEKLRLAMNRALVSYGDMLANYKLAITPELQESSQDILSRTEVLTAEPFPSKMITVENQQGVQVPLYEQLDKLNKTEKVKLTKSLEPVVQNIINVLGIKSQTRIDIGKGLFEGQVNPNFLIRVTNKTDPEQAIRDAQDLSRATSFVFKQEAVPFVRPIKVEADAPYAGFIFNLKENVDGKGFTSNQLSEMLTESLLDAGFTRNENGVLEEAGFTLLRPNQISIVDFGADNFKGDRESDRFVKFAQAMDNFYSKMKDAVFGQPEIFGYDSTYNVDDPKFTKGGKYDHRNEESSDRATIIQRIQEGRPKLRDLRGRLNDLTRDFTETARAIVREKQDKAKSKRSIYYDGPRFQFAPVETKAFQDWFGDSKITNPDGTPRVMYHGTAASFTTFKPKQAKAVFVTPDPEFAEDFSDASRDYMYKNVSELISLDDIKHAMSELLESKSFGPKGLNITEVDRESVFEFLNDYDAPVKHLTDDLVRFIINKEKEAGKFRGKVKRKINDLSLDENDIGPVRFGLEQTINAKFREYVSIGPNIMPLYVSAKKPFDYENSEHIEAITRGIDRLAKREGFEGYGGSRSVSEQIVERIFDGSWHTIESREIQDEIKRQGFDAFYVKEGGEKNLAVYEGAQLKSASGNSGRFSKDSANILYQFGPVVGNEKAEQARHDSFVENATIARESVGMDEVNPEDKEAIKSREETLYRHNERILPYTFVPKNIESSERLSKGTFDTDGYDGKVISKSTQDNIDYATQIMSEHFEPDGTPKNENNWVQVGYNPKYYSYYYTRHNDRPVESADEIVQVGGLVLAKNPVLGAKPNYKYQFAAEVESKLGKDVLTRINETVSKTNEKETTDTVQRLVAPEPIDSIFGRIRQAAINQYEGIERMMNLAAGQLPEGYSVLKAENNALASALFSDFGAAISSETFKRGVPVYEDGITLVQSKDKNGNKIKGLMEVFEPLMIYDDPDGTVFEAFQFYMSAKRAEGLKKRKRYKEQLFTPDDINKANALEQAYPEFKQVAQDYAKFNRAIVKYLVDTQVLSKEMGEMWASDSFYIPFYRQLEGQATSGPQLLQGLSGQKIAPKIKGGKRKLNDLFLNVTQNTRAAIESGLRNVAATKVLSYATRLNDPAGTSPLAIKVSKKMAAYDDVVRIRENGKDTYYQVADWLLLQSMQSFAMPHIPMLEFLSKPAQFLREMVTRDPGFMMANLFRDSLSGWFTSGAKGFKPVLDSLSKLRIGMENQSDEAQLLVSAGVGTGYEFKANILDGAQEVRKQMQEKAGTLTGVDRVRTTTPVKLWKLLERGTTASDIATRAAVAKRVLADGGSRAEAVYQAIEIMNFNRKGSSAIIRILAAAIPFLNARIQGLDVLYRAGFGRLTSYNKVARHKAFLNRAGAMILTSLMYYYMVRDDEEYKNAEEYEKDLNWIVGGAMLPIPFELGILFKTVPERLAAYFSGNIGAEKLAESMKRNVGDTLKMYPIPQTLKPAFESMMNHSLFTGEDIVSKKFQGIDERYQANTGTSFFAKALGENTGISPIQIDFLVRGYTGTLGSYMIMLADSIFKSQDDPVKPSLNIDQMPIIKRFMATKDGTGPITEMYKLRSEVDEVTKTLSFLESTGQQQNYLDYLKENQNLITVAPLVQKISKDVQFLNRLETQTQTNKMLDAEVKRQRLNTIKKMKLEATKQIRELYKYSRP